MKKILILSANPKNTNQLRLDEEVREIQSALERSRNREEFQLIIKWAVRINDLRRALLDETPQIVHFSGHGVGTGNTELNNNQEQAQEREIVRKHSQTSGIVLEDDFGQMQLVGTKALTELFELFKDQIDCILLNACYSQTQAEAIYQHIDCVIGMNRAIPDNTAIKFSVGFYDAIGAGRTYADAFKFGCNNINLNNIPDDLIPAIKNRNFSKTLFPPRSKEKKAFMSGDGRAINMGSGNYDAGGEKGVEGNQWYRPVLYLLWKDNDGGQLFGTPTPVIPARIQFKPSVFIPFASLVITALVTVVRLSAILQSLELKTFDQMMRLRPDEGIDPRLLVVNIDETDRKYQDENGMKRRDSSLSDTALAQLLEKIEPLQPRVIGLDIIRDFSVSSDQPKLAKNLQNTDNFIGICIGNDPTNKDHDSTIREKGIKPPPEVPAERIGFADVHVDSDGILRRHLWSATFNSNTACNTEVSLSLKLALYYLAKKDIKLERTGSGDLVLGKARLQRLLPRAGGYQNLQNDGYQMLLNYRSRNIARQCSLTDILQKNTCNPSWVKDKIILIGVTASSVKDDFYTPYSINQQPDQTMRGVVIQAQMVSQIISAALDGDPSLLKVLPWWGDIFYTWIWSLVGGVFGLPGLQKVTLRSRKIIFVLASIGFIFTISYGTCLFVLIKGYWLPFIPSTIAAFSTGIIMFSYIHKNPYKRQ